MSVPSEYYYWNRNTSKYTTFFKIFTWPIFVTHSELEHPFIVHIWQERIDMSFPSVVSLLQIIQRFSIVLLQRVYFIYFCLIITVNHFCHSPSIFSNTKNFLFTDGIIDYIFWPISGCHEISYNTITCK